MSLPGWYPDPSGQHGRFRYWDGRAWSAQTTDNPRTRPPVPPGGAPGGAPGGEPPERRRGRAGLLIGVIAVLLALVLAGVFVVRGVLQGDATAGSDPSSTVSGWDDSSPLPSATPTPTPSRTPSRTPSPTPTATSAAPSAPLVACPTGDPSQRASHPSGKRYYGGGLSFAPHDGWEYGGSYLDGLSWAYDVDGEMQSTEPGWAAILSVGSIRIADGFDDPRIGAAGVMQCIATSGYYLQVESRKDVVSRAVTVGGKPGWEVRSEIRVGNEGLSVEGDLVSVIVVDTGSGESLAMFVGAVPIGDKARISTLDTTISDLQVY